MKLKRRKANLRLAEVCTVSHTEVRTAQNEKQSHRAGGEVRTALSPPETSQNIDFEQACQLLAQFPEAWDSPMATQVIQ
jgi:hypothetical protein